MVTGTDIQENRMLQVNDNDYYDGFTEDTQARLDRIQQYVSLALKNGDAAYQEKPGELVIKIRLKKKEKP
jgi:predicted GIY-YIG superfamily endonuclease